MNKTGLKFYKWVKSKHWDKEDYITGVILPYYDSVAVCAYFSFCTYGVDELVSFMFTEVLTVSEY